MDIPNARWAYQYDKPTIEDWFPKFSSNLQCGIISNGIAYRFPWLMLVKALIYAKYAGYHNSLSPRSQYMKGRPRFQQSRMILLIWATGIFIFMHIKDLAPGKPLNMMTKHRLNAFIQQEASVTNPIHNEYALKINVVCFHNNIWRFRIIWKKELCRSP